MPSKKRDYADEYRAYHAKPEQKKRTAARIAARPVAVKKFRMAALKGKEVDHLGSNPHGDLRKRRTKVVSKAANRKRQPKRS